MIRFAKPLATSALILALSPALCAQQADATPSAAPFHGTYAELKGHSFKVGDLVVTVTDYYTILGVCAFKLSIANPTAQPITVSSEDITVIDAEQQQFLAVENNKLELTFHARILPGAHVEPTEGFIGSGSVKLPAKLYFQGQLLAEFSK